MWFIPYKQIAWDTRLKESEIRRRLNGYVAPVITYMVQVRLTDKPFKGKITTNGFEMMRVVSSRNSWLPLVNGNIESTINGSCIKIKMRMHSIPLLFTLFFLGVTLLVGLSGILASIRTGVYKWQDILIPFGFFLFGYTYSTATFHSEASLVKEFMSKLLQKDYKKLLKEDWEYPIWLNIFFRDFFSNYHIRIFLKP